MGKVHPSNTYKRKNWAECAGNSDKSHTQADKQQFLKNVK